MAWLITRGGVYYKGERVSTGKVDPVTGKPVFKDKYTSLRTTSRQEALSMVESGESPQKQEKSLEDPLAAKIQAFLRYLRSINLKPGTIAIYMNAFVHMRKFIKSLDDFKAKNREVSENLDKFMAHMREFAPATHGMWLRCIRAFLRWNGLMLPKGLGAESDILRKVLVGEKDEFRGRRLSDREKEILFTSANTPHMERFLRFKYESGLRLEQVLFLTWGQIIPEENRVHVYKQKRQPERYVPLLDHGITVLGPRPENSMDSDRVFTQWSDKSAWYVQFRNTMRRARKKGLTGRVRPHDLRHTRASDLVKKYKFREFQLLAFFGWSDLKLAQRYVHTTVDDLLAQLKA